MKIILTFISLIFSFISYAQTGTSIKYKRESMSDQYPAQYSRFVYNDSFAFHYFYANVTDPLRKEKIFSKRMVHHSFFCNKASNNIYNEVNYPAGNTFLIKDTLQNDQWQLSGGKKNIGGIDCISYLKITPKNDTVLVFISKELGDGKGYGLYTGLPGTPLEIYDQEIDSHLIAVEIKKDDYSFVLPDKKIVSRKEYYERRKNK